MDRMNMFIEGFPLAMTLYITKKYNVTYREYSILEHAARNRGISSSELCELEGNTGRAFLHVMYNKGIFLRTKYLNHYRYMVKSEMKKDFVKGFEFIEKIEKGIEWKKYPYEDYTWVILTNKKSKNAEPKSKPNE